VLLLLLLVALLSPDVEGIPEAGEVANRDAILPMASAMAARSEGCMRVI
jgi:hypothetical protein